MVIDAVGNMILNNVQRFIIAGIVLAFFCILAYATRFIFQLIHHFTSKTKTNFDDFILAAIKTPVRLLLITLGLFFAAFIIKPDLQITEAIGLKKFFGVLFILLGSFVVSRVFKALIQWYVVDMSHRYKSVVDDTAFRFGRRAISIFIYVVALLLVLGHLGIQIGPLITGLGIAGLAVALALQDTLSNFFASLSVTVDRICKVGDYVELDGGVQGFVEDVGWRTTRVRTRQDNLVVIPNSKLTQTIITNYSLPKSELSIRVPVDVAYGSNLDHVEKVTLEVAKQVQKIVSGAVKNFEPEVRFKEFKDSGIGLAVTLRAEKFEDQFHVQHEFIKQLIKRYHKEKIEIPYPQRVVHLKQI